MTAMQIVRLMNREDRIVAAAVARELPAIARAVEAIVQRIENGGRLIYVGAGSSGRIAMLDASECPPTFGTPLELVQALIAGGKKAMTQAVEGAEDRRGDAVRDLKKIRLTGKWNNTLRPRGAGLRKEAQGADDCDHVEPEIAPGARGKNCHRAGGGPGSDCGLDETEGGDSAETGPEHALNRNDGAPGPSV